MSCHVQASGAIELHFYGELPLPERSTVQAHLAECAECRRALDDLTVIRAALAIRPDVATPPAGDWSGFMARLDRRIADEADEADVEPAGAPPVARVITLPRRRRVVPYVAVAAVLVLVTISAVVMLRQQATEQPPRQPQTQTATSPAPAAQLVRAVNRDRGVDPNAALTAVSGQHFERSKLVVLGLAMKDARRDDWVYERDLAASLLNDTRLYRLAAEERGMQSLVGVMRDLELVLLQTSMSERPDAASLEQLQRLIRRRDLITKMNVATADGF